MRNCCVNQQTVPDVMGLNSLHNRKEPWITKTAQRESVLALHKYRYCLSISGIDWVVALILQTSERQSAVYFQNLAGHV